MVASPVLMPPPIAVPKSILFKVNPQIAVANNFPFKAPPTDERQAINPVQQSNKLCCGDSLGVTNRSNTKPSAFKKVFSIDKKVICSEPTKDVHCYITNNTEVDYATKKLVHQQLSKKIYTRPDNARLMPKRNAEPTAMEKFQPMKTSGIKVEKEHFIKKKMKIDDIDIEYLARPVRSSTPTPINDGSTIMAGHLDFTIDADDLDSTVCEQVPDENESHNDSDDIFQPYLKKIRKKTVNSTTKDKCTDESYADNHHQRPVTTEMSKKLTLCSAWMAKEDGVSTNNTDEPPSIYEPSLALSDSLLDVTSVSRNPPQTKNILKKKDTVGRGINFESYKNTSFM